MKRNRKWGIGGTRGTIVVEAALTLPLLALLMVGVLEFGRILMIKQIITNAAREGARVAAVNLNDTEALDSATAVAQDYLNRSGVDLSLVTIAPDFSDLNGTEAVRVSIDYEFGSDLSGWIPGIPQKMDLRSEVMMRREA